MYSDLLDVLGNQSSPSIGSRRVNDDKHVAVSFKAGKMKMQLQENGKYWITPDTRRGEVQLVWSDGDLKWEWIDRGTKAVVESETITATAGSGGGSFERIDSPDGRVYLKTGGGPNKQQRDMYWMQDLNEEKEDELIAQVNQYLTNPSDAAPEGASVDALSNILENLGMPEQQQPLSGGGTTTPSAPATGTLTLADLQGAMAGLAPAGGAGTSSNSTPTPLSEVVTPAAIQSLLQDDDVKTRLLELLPEEQRSMEHLEDNLRSPQIQQTLRALSQALLPDDAGSMEGYHSVIANFQLDPKDGEAALAAGNPIQAFLDCILASVKKEEEGNEESKDDAMEE